MKHSVNTQYLLGWVRMIRLMMAGKSFSGRERNCCFLNTRTRRFADISATSGLEFPDDGRAVASMDWDRDGDLDLWFSNRSPPRLRFMRNDGDFDNHFVSLQLRGNGSSTNRDAIGALVHAKIGDRWLVRPVIHTTSYLSSADATVHFGLGIASRVDAIVVSWPGGMREKFPGVSANQYVVIRKGDGHVEGP